MLNLLYGLWLESPPIRAPGFIAALVVAGLGGYLCFAKVRVKAWNVFSKSLAVAFCCFVILLIFAIIGILVVSTGILGMARSWASFGDAYVWGVFSLPLLAFFLSLGSFALTNHSRATR
ncbi:hypothetical protein [Halothiobacillus neapolitanus]|uniref:Transmembrane protein n=1 Tax=Halothiobacillus neapolitanus (strain ATCC 23641 / DSM 15147 / CIP 104769 / NCIMB 8539 / c2) TaxID=555778 RepID=D0KWG7_HALNC|nr:hypothetical protein [Halothiobacillus neapolitanus]ACX94964.1 hypothetical protein Hneap_0099 [Halothiobacillus neapolitanus c2]TDN61085.1 hypothetical protein C8D83_103218 [Halothiobacillus neapolitanus]